jgi:NhaA family Na+:H+ antiporter
MYRVSPFVRHFACALIGGVVVATVWVNLSPASYYDAVELRLADLPMPDFTGVADLTLTPLSIVSEGLMALFLFFIGKELWEAVVLERGALSGRADRLMPIGAVVGGMLGAALVWTLWSMVFVTAEEAFHATGWPRGVTVPYGSDVVLCYVFGRMVFGREHPALHLLLLITIGFDIAGLLATGLANPLAVIRPLWLLLPVAALGLTWATVSRLAHPDATERQHRRAHALWPYLLAGLACWTGVALSGLPPALGLLPLIPIIPHAERSFGLFAEAEEYLSDPLNRLTHLMVRPLPWILFLFGLTRGGVDFLAFAPSTGSVLAALWLGKPLGLIAGVLIAGAFTGRLLPRDLRLSDLLLIAVISGTGFTVPVLSIGVALPGGEVAEAARLGLALSLCAGPFAILLSRLIRPRT